MIRLQSLLSISDFWGWLQILGSLLGVIYIYRYKDTLTKKYIKTIEKDVYKKFGVPAGVLFNDTKEFNGSTKISKLLQPKEHKQTINKQKYKRNVSELAKKIVASNQKWKCAKCQELLDFTYEIDHIKPLYKGGSNEMKNLRALCRGCHGRFTLLDRVM